MCLLVENLKELLEVEVSRDWDLSRASFLKLWFYCFDPTLVLVLGVYACGQTRMPLQRQRLHFIGKKMQNAGKLRAVGIEDGDLVMMVPSSDRCSCFPS